MCWWCWCEPRQAGDEAVAREIARAGTWNEADVLAVMRIVATYGMQGGSSGTATDKS